VTTPVIIDVFAVALLLGFTICGVKRGLLQSLAGLIIVVTALIGASMVASACAEPAAEFVAPLIEDRLSERVEQAIAAQAETPERGESELSALLEKLGISDAMQKEVADRVGMALSDTISSAADAAIPVIIESLVQSFLYALILILAFILLLILLRLVMRAVNLVMRLPGLNVINALGGGILGLAEGVLLLFLAIWAAGQFGISFEEPPWVDTRIFRMFATSTPLGLLSLLQ